MKKVLIAVFAVACLVAPVAAFAGDAPSDDLHATAIPGGKLISVTTYTEGVFSPHVTVVTRLLCMDNTPCVVLGSDAANGNSAANAVVSPSIYAGGIVGAAAALRPTRVNENTNTSTTVSNGSASFASQGQLQGQTALGLGGHGGNATALGLGGDSSSNSSATNFNDPTTNSNNGNSSSFCFASGGGNDCPVN